MPVSIHVAFATAAQGDSEPHEAHAVRPASTTRRCASSSSSTAVCSTASPTCGSCSSRSTRRGRRTSASSSTTASGGRVLRHVREIKRLPSEYFSDNILTTFITDPYAVPNRHYIGAVADDVVERLPALRLRLAQLVVDHRRVLRRRSRRREARHPRGQRAAHLRRVLVASTLFSRSRPSSAPARRDGGRGLARGS